MSIAENLLFWEWPPEAAGSSTPTWSTRRLPQSAHLAARHGTVAGAVLPVVLWCGTVSLLADFVYERARSVTGLLVASLGTSALVVGFVTGAGEAAALALRLVAGPLADRVRRL